MQAKDARQQALMERLMKDMGAENRDWTLNIINIDTREWEEVGRHIYYAEPVRLLKRKNPRLTN